MLSEIDNVRQIPGEGYRRWFIDKDMDLIIWYNKEKSSVQGFQISYDKLSVQRTVTWKRSDSGHPSLTCDGPYNKKRLVRLLQQNSVNLEPNISQFILQSLDNDQKT